MEFPNCLYAQPNAHITSRRAIQIMPVCVSYSHIFFSPRFEHFYATSWLLGFLLVIVCQITMVKHAVAPKCSYIGEHKRLVDVTRIGSICIARLEVISHWVPHTGGINKFHIFILYCKSRNHASVGRGAL